MLLPPIDAHREKNVFTKVMKQLLSCKMTIICGKCQSIFTGTISFSTSKIYVAQLKKKKQVQRKFSNVFWISLSVLQIQRQNTALSFLSESEKASADSRKVALSKTQLSPLAHSLIEWMLSTHKNICHHLKTKGTEEKDSDVKEERERYP